MDPFKPYEPRRRTAPPKLTAADAEAVALTALGWIVADETLRARFLALTGCDGDELRRRAGQPAFLGAVLDFVLADEPTVLAFTEQQGMAPETPMLAREKLP